MTWFLVSVKEPRRILRMVETGLKDLKQVYFGFSRGAIDQNDVFRLSLAWGPASRAA